MSTEYTDHDDHASQRKQDHISLTSASQVANDKVDNRFYYEPMLSGHATDLSVLYTDFAGKQLHLPLWISSMTGGTEKAKHINKNLARACGEFGMGMGLGSCRSLLTSDERLSDFDVRQYMGNQPLYANLGIAQIEQLLAANKVNLIKELLAKLSADGLIVHVNPLQEWMQPEGDRYQNDPITLIKMLLDAGVDNIIVKEVGQGFGPRSMRALLQLPLTAIDFGASGGTNFALLEVLRSAQADNHPHLPLVYVGHTAEEMVDFVNRGVEDLGNDIHTKHIIISGGVKDFLHGYHLTMRCALPAIYGQASAYLTHALDSYDALVHYVESQKQGLLIANSFLKVR